MKKHQPTPKNGHVQIRQMPITGIKPAPENDRVYRPIDPNETAFIALVESIRQHGSREPLVVSEDGFIASGKARGGRQ